MSAETYRVFSRKPYRRVRSSFGAQYIPNPGARRYTLARGVSYSEALRLCAQGPANKARDAGREYRHLSFYEFERE